jgi:hypothetical protein
LVAEVERGWREGWQVRQIPVGPAHVAQEGSHAVTLRQQLPM